MSTYNEKCRTRNIRLIPWSHFQNLCGIVWVSRNSKDQTLLIDVVNHQNLMFDFILVCITQWVVYYSPRRWQEIIDKNLDTFNRLVSKGEAIRESIPDLLINMLTFCLEALGIFFHDEVANLLLFFLHCHLHFLLLGALFIDGLSTSI